MKQYNVYSHAAGWHETVKQGWSWPAFFFALIWAFVKGLWAVGFIYLAVIILFSFTTVDPSIDSLLSIMAAIVFGYNGNKWREKNLFNKGYKLIGTTVARNGEDALASVLNK